jgi:glucose-1-phosphatase
VAFEAVIFDIGGILEITPPTGWQEVWATHLDLTPAQLLGRLEPIWSQGELGTLPLPEIERQTARALDLDQPRLR